MDDWGIARGTTGVRTSGGKCVHVRSMLFERERLVYSNLRFNKSNSGFTFSISLAHRPFAREKQEEVIHPKPFGSFVAR